MRAVCHCSRSSCHQRSSGAAAFQAKRDDDVIEQEGHSALADADVVAVQGNFAVTSGLKLTDALKLEDMTQPCVNVVAVKRGKENTPLAKDIVRAYQSAEFQAFFKANPGVRQAPARGRGPDGDAPRWGRAARRPRRPHGRAAGSGRGPIVSVRRAAPAAVRHRSC